MPALLTQRPRLVWHAPERRPLVAPDRREAAPALAEDFSALDEVLVPVFHAFDEDALRSQNSFRRAQVLVILGGSLATALGTVQTALGGGVTELGVVSALVAGAVAAAVTYIRGRDAQKEYLDARLKAERLRGEYFLFLGGVTPYEAGSDGERRARLRERVNAIESEDPV